MKVAIIGCGIVGLTSAIQLIASGHQVTIYTKHDCLKTDSDLAGASWFSPGSTKPLLHYHCVNSIPALLPMASNPESGVKVKLAEYFFAREEEFIKSPFLLNEYKDYFLVESKKLSGGQNVIAAEVIHFNPEIYRPYLLKNFYQLGGSIKHQEISSFDDFRNTADMVVNCSSYHASQLVNDELIYPVAAQIEFILHDEGEGFKSVNFPEKSKYILYRSGSGKFFIGASDRPKLVCRHIDKMEKKQLVNFANQYINLPSHEKSYKSAVGVRDWRSDLRLEIEAFENNDDDILRGIIHNYGHSGSGYSASWSCAQTVSDLIDHMD